MQHLDVAFFPRCLKRHHIGAIGHKRISHHGNYASLWWHLCLKKKELVLSLKQLVWIPTTNCKYKSIASSVHKKKSRKNLNKVWRHIRHKTSLANCCYFSCFLNIWDSWSPSEGQQQNQVFVSISNRTT